MTKGLQAGFLYFGGVFAVGFVFGILRTLAVQATPELTRLGAVLIELPVILAIAWWICGMLVRRFSNANSAGIAIIMGSSAFLLLLSAEAWLSVGLNNLSLQQHFALYQHPSHLIGLIGQLLFAAFPLIRALSVQAGAAPQDIAGDS